VRGLPKFAWSCSFRTWAFTLAFHAMMRLHRKRRRDRAQIPLPEAMEMAKLQQEIRSSTAPYLQTEVKARVAALRASLSAEEQTILTMRIDKDFSWSDVAQVILGDGASREALSKEEQRLKKSFSRMKRKLRALAQEAAILPQD